jgi:adenylate cyclase
MAATKGGVDELINQWSDGIVIAADLTTGAKDFGSTPVEPVFPLSGIHTALLNGILTGTFYSPTPFWIGMIIALILLAAVFLANRYLQGTALHLGFGILLLLLFIFVCVLWFQALILPWFFAPAMGLLAAWIAAFGLRVLKAHEERLLLESALSRYFSRALAMRVLTEKKIDLIPVSKEVTVLFADIAGFTRWSSDKTPELVHRFLCFYLESMASIIFDHGGTIDKFMGDGILAFFGDPLDQPDHAERALRTALDMQKKAHEIREMWFPRASMDLKIRIGVNTGQAIVGNLGSETRIEYTVIGAAVNFGQRMESNAPVGGTLVSHTTYEIAKTRFGFGEQRQVTVKGYDQPVTAYVLESEIAASKTDEIKK